MRGWRCYAADPQEHLQFNKIPTEGTYINKINTKRRYPTCKKPTKGDNNLQKYETDDQQEGKYEGKPRKDDLLKVNYKGKHTEKGDLQVGNPPFNVNTPWAPSGPERIEDAMRRDTATPSFWGLAFRDPFQQVVRAGLCLPIFWLILFDLVRPCQIL